MYECHCPDVQIFTCPSLYWCLGVLSTLHSITLSISKYNFIVWPISLTYHGVPGHRYCVAATTTLQTHGDTTPSTHHISSLSAQSFLGLPLPQCSMLLFFRLASQTSNLSILCHPVQGRQETNSKYIQRKCTFPVREKVSEMMILGIQKEIES